MASEKENKNLIERPPIVVVMGHIDHGKTKLLDAIRQTKVAEAEAGGITQSIGAYEITHKDKKITFIDTPGHQAFIAMRSHGAKVADLAILVVAADDGPKEQTWESYKIIKEADIPFMVVINKIDKPGADVLKTKNQLAEGGIYLEGFGGDIPFVEISAKEKIGINELLDLLILMAEMLELKADLNSLPSGVVVESHKDPKRGNSATLIIKEGVLKRGQFIATASTKGKIRIFEDFLQRPIEEAPFSSPVLVIGFESLPDVGERFLASFDEKDLETFIQKEREKEAEKKLVFSDGGKIELEIKLILKAKTLGALEALIEIVKNVKNKFEKIKIEIVKQGVGDISEEDAKVADSTKAIILGFDVKERPEIEFFLRKQHIETITDKIIYEIERKLEEKIKTLKEEKESIYLGVLEVLAVFNRRKKEQLIGGRVVSGQLKLKKSFEIFRNDELIGRGAIKSLRREKQDVTVVESGLECGLLVESETEIEKGDIIKVLK